MELIENQKWIIFDRGEYLCVEHCTSAVISQFICAMGTLHCNKNLLLLLRDDTKIWSCKDKHDTLVYFCVCRNAGKCVRQVREEENFCDVGMKAYFVNDGMRDLGILCI